MEEKVISIEEASYIVYQLAEEKGLSYTEAKIVAGEFVQKALEKIKAD